MKAQLDLERHGGRKAADVCAGVLQRLLALTAAISEMAVRRPGTAVLKVICALRQRLRNVP